jgi:hypothetical protein
MGRLVTEHKQKRKILMVVLPIVMHQIQMNNRRNPRYR